MEIKVKSENKEKKYLKGTYMMQRKTPFGVVAPNEWLENKGYHLIINQDQMQRACKDAEIEGPKIVLECIEKGTVPDSAMNQDFIKELRDLRAGLDKARKELEKTQAELLKSGTKAIAEEPAKPSIPEPVKTGDVGTGNENVDRVLNMLRAKETVGDVKDYAKTTLEMDAFKGNPSKDTVIEKIGEYLLSQSVTE